MAIRISSRAVPAGETLIAASRQVWLASLGAAVVTGEWAQKEAAPLFRTLVKEGTAIESRTFRLIGDTVETSFSRANSLWHQARSVVTGTVTGDISTPGQRSSSAPRSVRESRRS